MLLALFIWMISFHPLSDFLIKRLEYHTYPKARHTPRAVVVLGGGEVKNAPNLPTSASGTKRILYGLMLAYKSELPLIISGKEDESARATISQIIRSFDLPFKESETPKPMHYTIEGMSHDTFQNASYSTVLAPKYIYLVTSAFHMPRSYYLFRHFGFEITPAPTDYMGRSEYELLDLLPSQAAFFKTYWALHEYLGLLSLFLRGVL